MVLSGILLNSTGFLKDKGSVGEMFIKQNITDSLQLVTTTGTRISIGKQSGF